MKLTFHVIAIFVATVVFAGCSTTHPIVTEWRNPGYSAASFKRIMVGGLGGATSKEGVGRDGSEEWGRQHRAGVIFGFPGFVSMGEYGGADGAGIRGARGFFGSRRFTWGRSHKVMGGTKLFWAPGV